MNLRRVGNVAYKLDFPSSLSLVHPVFHVSILKKCLGVPSSVIPLEGLDILDSMSYEEVPIEILDRQVHRLWTKDVALIKILW